MLNLFKTKIPLLDPNSFPQKEIAYQHKIWEDHPYHLNLRWKNTNNNLSITHSYYKESITYCSYNKPRLLSVKGNQKQREAQVLLMQDLQFKEIIDYFITLVKEVKQVHTKNPNMFSINLSKEEKDYQWLLATTKILKNAVNTEKAETNNNETLLQYEIYFDQNAETFLRIKCFNLFFEFNKFDKDKSAFPIKVIDNKNNEHEPANRYDLSILDKIPMAVDIISDLLFFLKEQTSLKIKH